MAEETQRNVIELVWKSIDQTSDVLKYMGKGVGDFGNNLESVTGPAANFTTSLLKLEAGALAIGVALGGFAVNEAGKFDASMRELSTLIGGGEEGAKAFGKAIADMGQRSIVPLEDLTGAMYKAVSQTGSLDEAQKLVTVSEKLAVAGRADLTDTTLLLAGSLEAYGKNMDSAGKFSDTLFSIVQNGQTTLSELTQGLGGLAPTASNLGVSFEALGAAVAVITKNSVPTSEALTGLKAILSNILKPSTDAAALAKLLGINFTVSGLQAKGFAAFMVDVAAKTHGSATQIGTLFGSMEAFNSVMALASEGGSKFNNMLKNIEQSTGVTQKAYDLMAGAFGAGNQVILNNIKLLAIAFGSPLLEPVRHVQEAITNFFVLLQDKAKAGAFDEFFKSAQISIDKFAKGLETALTNLPAAFAKVDFKPLQEQLKLLGESLGGIGGNIDLTSVEGLTKALQFAVDAITNFVALNRGLIEVLPKVFFAIKDIAEIVGKLDPAWFEFAGVMFASLTVIDKVGGAFTGLKGILEGLGALLSTKSGLLLGLDMLGAKLVLLAGSGTAGFLGAAGAVGALSYAIGSFVINPLIDWTVKATTGYETLGGAIYEVTHQSFKGAGFAVFEHGKALQAWTLDIDDSIKSLGGFNVALNAYNTTLGLATGKQAEAGTSAQVLSKEAQTLADAFARAGRAATNTAELATAGFTVTTQSVLNAKGELVQIPDVYTNIGTAAQAAADTTETALEKSFKATQAAKDKAEEFRLEWAKLESQNRNIVFQASADIQVAQIEAQAAQVVAAFQSIDEGIKSTGDLLGKLSETFVGISSGKIFDKLLIESLLKEELQLRKDSFALQKRLVETQINYLNASTEKLKSGDALVTVKADGLKPELQAFVWKILEFIQIEASGSGQSFLLGLPQV